MTSSERHLQPGQARWNYDVQEYKDDRDVFREKGLFSVIVIAHGRPDITAKSVLSTIKCAELYDRQIEWIFVENGNCDANYDFFQGLSLERKVIVRQRNYGINHAINQGWALSRGEYCMIHENDWDALNICNFFQFAKEIFEEQPAVSIIQLRDPLDPNENHGSGQPLHNPWSCFEHVLERAKVNLVKMTTNSGHAYLVSRFPNGFNNNPTIFRKDLYRKCGPYPEPKVGCDPRHGETLYQAEVAKTEICTAQIGVPIYQHAGKVQTQAL